MLSYLLLLALGPTCQFHKLFVNSNVATAPGQMIVFACPDCPFISGHLNVLKIHPYRSSRYVYIACPYGVALPNVGRSCTPLHTITYYLLVLIRLGGSTTCFKEQAAWSNPL